MSEAVYVRIEKAIICYRKGKCTIRECAEIAGLRYFEFFDLLAKENLIGTAPEHTDILVQQLKHLK